MGLRIKQFLATGFVAAVALLVSLPSQAATVTYQTVRTGALINVNDAEGRWQFSGGKVMLGSTHVGYFIRKKRVSFAVSSGVNKAAVETTIIWKWGSHAMTVQGSHDFSSGAEVGGVSAVSAGFSAFADATFTGSHTSMTLTY